MTGFYSNYLIDKLLDHLLGKTAYDPPATVYGAIMLVAPTPAGGGTECAVADYARVAVANNTTNWAAASAQLKTNATQFSWGTPAADWGNGAGIAWMDSPAGGNLLIWSPFTTGIRTIRAGQPFVIAPGGLTTSMLTECTA